MGFSFLLFHEKGRKEKLLQLNFVRQPFPFLSPFGDIFPRPGEVFLTEGGFGSTVNFFSSSEAPS